MDLKIYIVACYIIVKWLHNVRKEITNIEMPESHTSSKMLYEHNTNCNCLVHVSGSLLVERYKQIAEFLSVYAN